MCGCLIVCNDKIHNGMSDYANDETAKIFRNEEEMYDPNYNFSKVEKMQKLIKQKIGTREQCMRRFVEICQK